MASRLVVASAASRRVDCARRWLASRAPGEEVLVVAASPDAANELLRELAFETGAGFGWHRSTPGRLASALSAEALAAQGAVPVGGLVAEAVAARALHTLRSAGALGRFAAVEDGPGLARAVAVALAELRSSRADAAALAKEAPELAGWLEAFESALDAAGLADRARVFALGARAARELASHPLLGRPTLWLDVAVESAVEADLVAAVAARAPECLATVPRGDAESEAHLAACLSAEAESLDAPRAAGSLERLQRHLFDDPPPPAELDDSVRVLSAPGESRECVEIARRIHALARDGVAFDRIAVLLRSPEEYRPHLVEALARASVPAHFARGAVGPDPAGRAFLALLACAAEDLSARRFAEYLSLGEVPDAAEGGVPPPAAPPEQRWVAPDEELVPEVVAAALAAPEPDDPGADEEPLRDGDAPVRGGTLRAPRRWERLLVDAAVIGGRDRWQRRLDGLAHELELDLASLDDADDPRGESLTRRIAELHTLRDYALPLLDTLAALPQSAPWAEWLDALSALASRALRRPERVLAVLAELAPMAAVGPVELGEVQGVLSRRLLELALAPAAVRYGKVFVGPADAARGLVFEAVFVPGLAERLFPKKIREEPILLDAVRERLGGGLATNEQRLARERRALHLAVGAAERHLSLSYPRLDLDQSRPRVPSFYALDAMRAATGTLPGFDDLARDAEEVGDARVGWPAPKDPALAIDEAEHDLALLDTLERLAPEQRVGMARYLLSANPHLGRALRFRARRWHANWTHADGLVPPPRGALPPAARAAIDAHQLGARSFSPTALQNYAACPYRFFLYAVHRLAPREEPEAIEEMDPLQRGSLVHDVQFELFGALRDAGLLPVTPERLPSAREHLDRVLDAVAARYRDDLAPAIERVWVDGVESVRADLREWLRRASVDSSGFEPWRFELSFGLRERRAADPDSRAEPVALDSGLELRGSIDLVERRADGALRATDHKTGKVRLAGAGIVAGGSALQPVLYALALEKLFPEARVESGRLYYCTAGGGFEERVVPLDAEARASADAVAEAVGAALSEPFLPAAPERGACRWCDYAAVCGPYEEQRVARKPAARLEPLAKVRELR